MAASAHFPFVRNAVAPKLFFDGFKGWVASHDATACAASHVERSAVRIMLRFPILRIRGPRFSAIKRYIRLRLMAAARAASPIRSASGSHARTFAFAPLGALRFLVAMLKAKSLPVRLYRPICPWAVATTDARPSRATNVHEYAGLNGNRQAKNRKAPISPK
jgi:hypothetical protein